MLDSDHENKSIPDWLVSKQAYSPSSDKDAFINKSILALLSVIARIRSQGQQTNDRFHISAQLMVLFTLILVVFISLSKSTAFLIVAITYLLLVLSTMKAKEIIAVLKMSLAMTLFTFVLLLPAAFFVNGYNPMNISTKVFATITAVNILSRSARFDSLIGSMKSFFVPDLFIFVLDITVKYILMLGEFCLAMLSALKLRSVGKNRHKYTALSGIAGTLFLKSGEMAEELHSAMECRGFTGEYHTRTKIRFSFADAGYLLINAALLYAYFYLNRG